MAQEARLTMVLVDTTVWIDFFAAKSTPEVAELERLLNEGEDICTCGIILTEVLQGIREDEDYQRTLSRFDTFLFLPMNRQAFVRAAELYRSLRRRGVTIRKPIDCMIASIAIEHDIALLHSDRDFDPIETHCGLKVVRTSEKPQKRTKRYPGDRG
ncbi:MAG: PIN domain nuclease [Desulfobacterales bacterium]|nr:PIN domain nuclease [Desulfobacterales bacterium]